MKVVTEKHICDMCKREINPRFTPGKLVFSFSAPDYLSKPTHAERKYDDLCADCCDRIEKAISLAIPDRTGDKK